jgi:hypothetical protein
VLDVEDSVILYTVSLATELYKLFGVFDELAWRLWDLTPRFHAFAGKDAAVHEQRVTREPQPLALRDDHFF